MVGYLDIISNNRYIKSESLKYTRVWNCVYTRSCLYGGIHNVFPCGRARSSEKKSNYITGAVWCFKMTCCTGQFALPRSILLHIGGPSLWKFDPIGVDKVDA